MVEGTVEIIQNGRGGSILYYEDRVLVRFSWEFAGSPEALVLVFGSPARAWNEDYPTAQGRQAEIYDAVSAEIVRQKAPGSLCKIDLEDGVITVMQRGS
jgi:hypothetical protein